MNSTVLKRIVLSALIGLLTAGIAWAFPLALMFTPMFIGYIGVAWGWGALAVASATSAFGIFSVFGMDTSVLGLLMLFVPESAVIISVFNNRFPYRFAVALCAVFAGVGMYMMVCLPALLEGLGPFDYFIQFADSFGKALEQNAAEMGIPQSNLDMIREFIVHLKRSAPSSAMTLICSAGMASGLANVAVAARLCFKKQLNIKPMAPFSRWQLSSGFTRGTALMLLGALGVMYLHLKNASAVLTAVLCILCGAYALMGVCLMAFTTKLKLKRRGFYIFSYVLMALLFPYSIYGLGIMGASDKLFRMREGYIRRNRGK